ncbi:MAG: DUF5721 family protein [Lachnospiraceae bacterium]|nr:DUF5721 family protein [Lachnospiraceae bacterium]
MQALELTDIKDFMNKFLRSEIFDHFLLQEGVIHSAASYVIDGRVNKGFYSENELEELSLKDCSFLPYAMLRGNFFDLIKGKKTPSSFKFVLLLSPENLRRTLTSTGSSFSENDITGVFINIRYQNQLLTLTTGISYNIFSTDKTLDNEWDRLVRQFLKQHEIAFEEL